MGEGGAGGLTSGDTGPPLPVGVRKATSPYLAGLPKPCRVDLSTRLEIVTLIGAYIALLTALLLATERILRRTTSWVYGPREKGPYQQLFLTQEK